MKKIEPTAAEAYAARRSDIARLIEMLEAELGDYDVRAAAEPKRWDFVGTLGHIRETLIGVVEGLTGREGQIEAMLAEAPNAVAETDACPGCGERSTDRLVWTESGDAVRCLACDRIYTPG